MRDYPRVRGGTFYIGARSGSNLGLSPRARGNLLYWRQIGLKFGTIPACAGEPFELTALLD